MKLCHAKYKERLKIVMGLSVAGQKESNKVVKKEVRRKKGRKEAKEGRKRREPRDEERK